MYTTNLRKVGGSIVLAVPPVFPDQLRPQAGAAVGLAVNHGYPVVNPNPRPCYVLAGLLAVPNCLQPRPADEREWVDAPAVGGELL